MGRGTLIQKNDGQTNNDREKDEVPPDGSEQCNTRQQTHGKNHTPLQRNGMAAIKKIFVELEPSLTHSHGRRRFITLFLVSLDINVFNWTKHQHISFVNVRRWRPQVKAVL